MTIMLTTPIGISFSDTTTVFFVLNPDKKMMTSKTVGFEDEKIKMLTMWASL